MGDELIYVTTSYSKNNIIKYNNLIGTGEGFVISGLFLDNVFKYNNVVDSLFKFYSDPKLPRDYVNATHNWWGTTNCAELKSKFKNVTFEPFLNAPYPDGVPIYCPRDVVVPCRDETAACGAEGVCCEGLKEVPYGGLQDDGQCLFATCGKVCRPCGNGVCDENEDKCTCPEDCKAELVYSPITVKGRLIDELTRKGIAGLKTSLGDISYITDSEGNFELIVKEIDWKKSDPQYDSVNVVFSNRLPDSKSTLPIVLKTTLRNFF